MSRLNPSQFGGAAGGLDWDSVLAEMRQVAADPKQWEKPPRQPLPTTGPLKGTNERAGHWRDPQPTAEPLKMFMSTNEILESHQPLEGDREQRLTDIGHRRYPPQEWDRSAWGEFAGTSEVRSERPLNPAPGQRGRTAGGGQLIPLKAERVESNEELFARKLSEAETYSEHDRHTAAGESVGRGSTPSRSLADAVRAEGVQKPISLSTEQFGHGGIHDEGKPMIVGGHHRLAVMKEHDPEALMPVLHFKNLREAQRRGQGYKYS